MKEPKDLGVKIGTKKEAEWKKILEVQKENQVSHEINLEVSKAMIYLAEKNIAIEKEKFK